MQDKLDVRQKEPLYVIQKHYASHVHYDFRLEIAGTLKSWAIPKEPSMDPQIQRLAIETEDHPLAYAGFQGTIPAGQYGAGKVEVWDSGSFKVAAVGTSQSASALRAYNKGVMRFCLLGKKLRGNYLLRKVTRLGRNNWLLSKIPDEAD